MLKKLGILLFVTLFLAGCGTATKTPSAATDQTPVAANDLKTYTNTNQKFSISYPEDWTVQANAAGVSFLSGQENTDDVFQENLGVNSQTLSADASSIPLSELAQETGAALKDQVQNLTQISSTETKLGGHSAWENVYTIEQNGFKARLKQYLLIEKNVAYTITFTAAEDAYASYEAVANKSIATFELK